MKMSKLNKGDFMEKLMEQLQELTKQAKELTGDNSVEVEVGMHQNKSEGLFFWIKQPIEHNNYNAIFSRADSIVEACDEFKMKVQKAKQVDIDNARRILAAHGKLQ